MNFNLNESFWHCLEKKKLQSVIFHPLFNTALYIKFTLT